MAKNVRRLDQKSRQGSEQFEIPKSIRKRAQQSKDRIWLTPKEIMSMMTRMDEVLNGDSNDDEHEMLYLIREELSELSEDPERWEKP